MSTPVSIDWKEVMASLEALHAAALLIQTNAERRKEVS